MFPHVPVLLQITFENIISTEGVPWPWLGLMSSYIWLSDTKASFFSSRFLSVAIGNHRAIVTLQWLYYMAYWWGCLSNGGCVGVVLWGLKHRPGIRYYAKVAFYGQCALEASTHPGVCWSHGNGGMGQRLLSSYRGSWWSLDIMGLIRDWWTWWDPTTVLHDMNSLESGTHIQYL